jgi:hypothetical protein
MVIVLGLNNSKTLIHHMANHCVLLLNIEALLKVPKWRGQVFFRMTNDCCLLKPTLTRH